jgi:hypothetical protein
MPSLDCNPGLEISRGIAVLIAFATSLGTGDFGRYHNCDIHRIREEQTAIERDLSNFLQHVVIL